MSDDLKININGTDFTEQELSDLAAQKPELRPVIAAHIRKAIDFETAKTAAPPAMEKPTAEKNFILEDTKPFQGDPRLPGLSSPSLAVAHILNNETLAKTGKRLLGGATGAVSGAVGGGVPGAFIGGMGGVMNPPDTGADFAQQMIGNAAPGISRIPGAKNAFGTLLGGLTSTVGAHAAKNYIETGDPNYFSNPNDPPSWRTVAEVGVGVVPAFLRLAAQSGMSKAKLQEQIDRYTERMGIAGAKKADLERELAKIQMAKEDAKLAGSQTKTDINLHGLKMEAALTKAEKAFQADTYAAQRRLQDIEKQITALSVDHAPDIGQIKELQTQYREVQKFIDDAARKHGIPTIKANQMAIRQRLLEVPQETQNNLSGLSKREIETKYNIKAVEDYIKAQKTLLGRSTKDIVIGDAKKYLPYAGSVSVGTAAALTHHPLAASLGLLGAGGWKAAEKGGEALYRSNPGAAPMMLNDLPALLQQLGSNATRNPKEE